jgi:hypothetical protein
VPGRLRRDAQATHLLDLLQARVSPWLLMTLCSTPTRTRLTEGIRTVSAIGHSGHSKLHRTCPLWANSGLTLCTRSMVVCADQFFPRCLRTLPLGNI